MKKILLALLLLMTNCSAFGKHFLSNVFQSITFYVGSNTDLDFNTKNSNNSFVFGGGVGLNYITFPPLFGLRLKYLYFDRNQSQSLGGLAYWHILETERFDMALALGGGTLFHTKDKIEAIGGYVEMGFGIFKTIPINADVVYRINMFNDRAIRNHNATDVVTHNLNIIFAIF